MSLMMNVRRPINLQGASSKFTYPRQAAFTLIELLIALALVGLIVTLLFSGLRMGNKAWQGSAEKTERYTVMRLVWSFLSERITQARPMHLKMQGESKLVFYGANDAIEFVTPMPAHLGGGGLYIVRIQAKGSSKKQQLIFTRWAYNEGVLSGEGDVPEWQSLKENDDISDVAEDADRASYSQSVLIDELKKIEMSYIGIEPGADEVGDWQEEWDEQQMPVLVKMHIEDADGVWPDMVFRVP